MFPFPRRKNTNYVQPHTTVISPKLIIEKGGYQPTSTPLGPPPGRQEPEPDIGPLADLCRDIRNNPELYERTRLGLVQHKVDPYVYLGMHGAGGLILTDDERKFSRPTYDWFMALHADDVRAEEGQRRADLTARLAAVKSMRENSQPVWPNRESVMKAQFWFSMADVPREVLEVIGSAFDIADQVFQGTHKIVPVGRVTIETCTPGNPHPAIRDFLTDTGPSVYRGHPNFEDEPDFPDVWVDRAGITHRTRALMRVANKAIRTALGSMKDC